ncbi:MAG: hypothetical protein NDI66_08390 [Pseudomonas sp.]|nr:hypothetical protein [Pseudomonas sp.]
MSHAIPSTRCAASASARSGRSGDGFAALRALLGRLADAWRHAAAHREFNRLDAAALRDLGLTRSEFDSYWAETHGQAEPTRLRVIGAGRRAS